MPGTLLGGRARRYADAAFSVAQESQSFDQWQTALDELARVASVPSARAVFFNPTVSPTEKLAALDHILPNLPPLIHNFLSILVERNRFRLVDQVAEAFRERVNQERGVLAVDVTTAVPLDADLQRLIAQRLGTVLNHDPQRLALRSHVDPSIIGGVVARVGDQLIDDSVRGRLQRLRRALASGV